MKTTTLLVLTAGFVLLLFTIAPLRAADATYDNVIINDNLTVTGTGYFPASTAFGSWSEGGGVSGFTLNYVDGGTTAINFIGSGTSSIWQWWQFNGSTNLLSMQLDQNNQLNIYTSGTGGTVGITLNPAGMSTFAGSVTINGTNSVLPNQALVSGSSILTGSLGDARYLQISATSSYVSGSNLVTTSGTGIYGEATQAFGLVEGSASGPGSLAIANGAFASGTYSIAIGDNAGASGLFSVALGVTTRATGPNSVAIGYDSFATAPYSFAGAQSSTASGTGSTALGQSSIASGYQSVALGFQSTASGQGANALGNQSTASGQGSVATGYDAVASGYGSNASGVASIASQYLTNAAGYSGVANGYASSAGGVYSTASGWSSIGSGNYSTANGWAAVASGPYSTASGDYSTSAGSCTNATGYDQFVIGQWNITQGNASSWVPTDNLFIVGNGLGSGTNSNAFTVNKNGDTTVSGALVVSGTSGNPNTIASGGLGLTGTAVPLVVGSGTVTTVVSTGSNNTLLLPQQGDLLMGVFVAGPQPPH